MLKKESLTIRDIAQEANVSVATVSRHINGTGYVGEDTGRRIQAIIDRAGFFPSRMAQGLKNRVSKMVMLIVPDIENPFYSSMFRVIQTLLRDTGYSLILYDANEDPKEELVALNTAQSLYMSGIILASIYVSEQVVDAIGRANIPAVVVNSYESCPFDSVHGVRGMGTDIATSHLIALGHTRIALAGGEPQSSIGRSRRMGYERAMRRAGLTPRAEYIVERGFSQAGGALCGEALLSLPERPTAICCANDLIAFGVLSALGARGLSVPKDMSLTGMDDISFAQNSLPRLTTVTNDSAEFAALAVKMLFDRILKRYTGKPRQMQVERELVVRDSTARYTNDNTGRE